MYDQSKLSELIRFARVNAGSTVIDVYPGGLYPPVPARTTSRSPRPADDRRSSA